MTKKQKGISPLIAVVVLVGFTIAVAIIITSALTTMTKTQTEQATQSAACPGALLNIYDVKCTNGLIEIVVVNAGQIDLKNFSITATINGNLYTNSSIAGDDIIQSGKTGKLEVYTPYSGEISKLILTAGNCPGMHIELTNETTEIATC